MKHIIIRIGKYFCLIFGILLVSSNIQIFSQTVKPSELMQLNEQREILKSKINNFIMTKQKIYESIEPIEGSNSGAFLKDYKKSLQDLEKEYFSYIQREQNYYSKLMPKRYMEELVYQYTGESNEIRGIISLVRSRDEAVFCKLERMTDLIIDLSDRKLAGLESFAPYRSLLPEAKIQEWSNCARYLVNRFDSKIEVKTVAELKTFYKEILAKLTVFFEKGVNPADVMEYAYRMGMLPKEQIGIKLTLQAMNDNIPVRSIVKNISKYFADFGTELRNSAKYNAGSLTKELEILTVGKRAKRVGEVVELNPGSRTFIKDLNKLDRDVKKRMIKNITGGFMVLAGLGAIATAEYIMDVSAENHFNSAATMSNKELAIIGEKIEYGTATVKEKFAFFTNPFCESFIEKNPVYTLSFVDFAADVYAAKEFLENQKAQDKKIKDEVEKNLILNLDNQIGKADFGTGTL